MKNIHEYLTPTARVHWEKIRSQPANEGLTIKVLLSKIMLNTPLTYSPFNTQAQENVNISPTKNRIYNPNVADAIGLEVASDGVTLLDEGKPYAVLDTPENRKNYPELFV